MLTLLSFIIEPPSDPLIDSPPGRVQLISTELESTPLTVLTVQLTWNLFPIVPCMGSGGDIDTTGVGTVCKKLTHVTITYEHMTIRAVTNVWFVRIFIKILVFGYPKSVFNVQLTCDLYGIHWEVILFTCTS